MKLRRRRLILNWPLGQRQCRFMRLRARRVLKDWLSDEMDRLAHQTLTGQEAAS